MEVETVGSRWHAATPHRRVGARRGARGTRRGRWVRVAIAALTTVLVALPGRHAHADAGYYPQCDTLADCVAFWSSAYGVSYAFEWCDAGQESTWGANMYNPTNPYVYGVYQMRQDTSDAIKRQLNTDMRLAPGLSYPDPEYGAWGDMETQVHLKVYADFIGEGYNWPTEGAC